MLDVTKNILLTFKGICMNFSLELKKKYFKSPSDLKQPPDSYETPCIRVKSQMPFHYIIPSPSTALFFSLSTI